MREISLDITKAVVYNKSLPCEGGCHAYVKANNGKSLRIKFDCSKSNDVAQYWNGGDIMWDQVDLIRSNPSILAVEEVDAEQIYVDGLGSVNHRGDEKGREDGNDHRFLDCQMGEKKTHEYPAYTPKPESKNSNKPGKVWGPLKLEMEFPNFAPPASEKKLKNSEKELKKKQGEQTEDPSKGGKMAVPASSEPIQHYDSDLNHYGDKSFYQQQYPGLGPNSKTAKADEVTHYNGLYQHDDQTDRKSPPKLAKKFKYKLSKRKEYNDQYKVLIEAPMKLYKDFMVATNQKKV